MSRSRTRRITTPTTRAPRPSPSNWCCGPTAPTWRPSRCGRKSQRVVTPQGTFYTIPCEGVFNAHPAVYRTALVGVRRGGATEPVLCVEREKGTEKGTGTISDAALRQELLALGAAHAHTKAIRTILFHPAFPVDIRHNAKIFREKLAAWAARRLS